MEELDQETEQVIEPIEQEETVIEQVPNTYYYDKLYEDKHLGSFTESTQLAHQLGWQDNHVLITDTEVSEVNGWTYLKGYAPKKSQEQLMNELKNEIISAVQVELDKTAQSKGYDNGFACASYSYSTDSIFKQEAQAYVEWRDKVWRYCYDLLDKYLAGEIEQPTIEYVLENMPKINWE